MGRYQTRPVSKDELIKIVSLIKNGFIEKNGIEHNSNPRIASLLLFQANVGLRIGDIVKLKLNDIIATNDQYYFNMIEEKTGKKRTFEIQQEVYNSIKKYCTDNNIKSDRLIFPITVRNVQKLLKATCDYLGYKNVSTHSFRKYYACNVYVNSGYNIALVKELLQHTSIATTQKYLNTQPSNYKEIIQKCTTMIDL